MYTMVSVSLHDENHSVSMSVSERPDTVRLPADSSDSQSSCCRPGPGSAGRHQHAPDMCSHKSLRKPDILRRRAIAAALVGAVQVQVDFASKRRREGLISA